MLPLLMVMSIYYISETARLDVFGESTYKNKIKNRSFADMIYAGMLETWWGGTSYMDTTWTLFIELWGSFLVFMIAVTAHAYRGRFLFYTIFIVTFL